MALSDDDYTRVSDPRLRGRALAFVAAAAAVALVAASVLALRSVVAGGPRAAATGGAPQPVLTPLPTPPPPQPVVGFGFVTADDPVSHQLVVYGGIDSYDQTWVFEFPTRHWLLAEQGGPPGRFNAAAAYDPASARVLMYGGRLGPGQLASDTWAWDGSAWSLLDAGGAPSDPPAGEGASMAWDGYSNQMVLVAGGGSWVWSGSRWIAQPGPGLPAQTQFIALADDPVSESLLGIDCCEQSGGAATTWAWTGTGWRQLASARGPAFAVAAALDPMTQRVMLLADGSLAAGRVLWQWSGRAWQPLAGPAPPVFPLAAVTSANLEHLVVLGSSTEAVQGNPQALEMWLWSTVQQWVRPLTNDFGTAIIKLPPGVRPTPIPTPPFQSP